MKKLLLVYLLIIPALVADAQVTLNITDFGAVNDGTTMNTTFIQAAIDSCFNAGGGEVVVPEGTFLSGTIFLKSNVLLRLDSAGLLKGSGEVADYPQVVSQVHGMADGYKKRSLIYAEGAHNIGIIGKGKLDGNSFSLPFVLNSGDRAFGVRFISCTNVRYEDITMINSSFWMMHNLDCDSVFITGVTINNQGVGNNDGIGIDGCRHVRIHDCTVNSFDDALAIKNTSIVNTHDVEIYNCSFASLARVIKIGTETIGDISNVHIHDCTVSQGSLGGPGEIGINLASIDGSHIDSVVVENITISGVQVPIVIRLGNSGRQYIDTLPPLPAGTFENIWLRNISGEGLNDLPCHITGIPYHPLENVHLENITFTVPGDTASVPLDLVVPENITERPEMDLFGNTLPAYGIYFRHVEGLTLDNVCITATQPDPRPMIFMYDVHDTVNNAVCEDIIFDVEENLLEANSMHVIYDMQNGTIELKNFTPGRFNAYSIDGRLIFSQTIEDSQTPVFTCSGFPFVWRFEAKGENFATGKVWLKR